jgi:hypothetical protein
MVATKAKRSMSAQLRKEVVEHVRSIVRKHRAAFAADAGLKTRVLTLTRALLPPRPKPRGRPANPETTRAIVLCNRFRRQHPAEKPRDLGPRLPGALLRIRSSVGDCFAPAGFGPAILRVLGESREYPAAQCR